jgi:nanoRNase/pAp phosphatase (c-di-AMP/oligoRNAs hydrolase)
MNYQDAKQLISESKNICVLPARNASHSDASGPFEKSESVSSALALFYTLKELNKNVNLIISEFPENLNFLVPSLDFISFPKNFVISIPKNTADVSQIYYEKNEENLKIHLTIDKGNIKKESLSFYYSDPKPDLIITLGVKDFQKELSKLDSFGFLLDAPILNIDNEQNNIKFGKINLVEEKSISEIVLELIKNLGENLVSKNSANCLLAGLVDCYDNFRSPKTNSEVFQTASYLTSKGAEHSEIVKRFFRPQEIAQNFLGTIFSNLQKDERGIYFSLLDSPDFQNFDEAQVVLTVEKIKTLPLQNDLLVLWKSHNSGPTIKGFLVSKNADLIEKLANKGENKNGWIYFSIPEEDLNLAKEKILN